MMLKNFVILKVIIPFIVPYIVLYALFIQINGETSPGGGFQAGVIFATGIIGLDLINDRANLERYFSTKSLIICATLGVALYGGVGAISLIRNDNYLDYNSLANNPLTGQHLGIFWIELGVGLTVSSVMCLIYFLLSDSKEGDDA